MTRQQSCLAVQGLIVTLSCDSYSLWDDYQKGLKIESGRTPLIIRFLGTKTKINILEKYLEGVPLSKLSEKGKPG